MKIKSMICSASMAALLPGCAGFQQAVTGYEAAAIKGVTALQDNALTSWVVLGCATPISAAIRHPEIIPALKALCLPGGSASNPSALLDVPQAVAPALPIAPIQAQPR